MSRGGVQDRGAWEEGSLLSRLCELCREWVGVGGTLESNILDLSKKMYLTNNTAASVMVISCERVKEREGRGEGEKRRRREGRKERGDLYQNCATTRVATMKLMLSKSETKRAVVLT